MGMINKTVYTAPEYFRKRLRGVFFIFSMIWPLTCAWCAAQDPQVSFEPGDRVLVLAPHPDDETIGCAGVIQKALKNKNPVRVVFLTFGDNNEWAFLEYRKHPVIVPQAVRNMGMVRHREALNAARVLGMSPGDLIFLGYPDFGTLGIWYRHWGQRPPFKSILTNAKAVPYTSAFRPGAAYKGEEILRDIKTIIKEFRPTKIFVSHPADHNPDHQSLYLFTKVALWELRLRSDPSVLPYPVHCKEWPRPRGDHPKNPLVPPAFIEDKIRWYVENLDPQEITRKRNALKAHVSQYRSSASYLASFIRTNELFGDFSPGKLHAPSGGPQLRLDTVPAHAQIPETLTDDARASFVGIEERSMRLDGDSLVCSFRLSRPLAKTIGVTLSFFGYRQDTAFAQMPKIYIKIGPFKHAAYDQSSRLPKGAIEVQRQAKTVNIRIPLKTLGMPTKILTNARTDLGAVSLDWVSWRTIEIVYN